MIKLKICGYREILPKETWKGVDYVGINLVPTSRRYVTEEKISGLLHSLPKNIETVAVTQNMPLPELLKIQEKYCFDYLQLHGNESREYCQKLRDKGYRIIKACTYENCDEYEDYPVDFLLIDNTQPGS
jgi:phosphoribosylanthranilate isomerase